MICLTCQTEAEEGKRLCRSCFEKFRAEIDGRVTQYSFVWRDENEPFPGGDWYVNLLERPGETFAPPDLPSQCSLFFISRGKSLKREELEGYAKAHWTLPAGIKSWRGHPIRGEYAKATPVYIGRHWGPDGPDVRSPDAKKYDL